MPRNFVAFDITVEKAKLLATLQENRERHKQMYLEALRGFLDKARQTFESRLQQIERRELRSLSVILEPPQDHTADYDQAISMLHWSQDASIAIDSEQFRCLVQDDWDWMAGWLVSNRGYSRTAAEYATSKSYLPGLSG